MQGETEALEKVIDLTRAKVYKLHLSFWLTSLLLSSLHHSAFQFSFAHNLDIIWESTDLLKI